MQKKDETTPAPVAQVEPATQVDAADAPTWTDPFAGMVLGPVELAVRAIAQSAGITGTPSELQRAAILDQIMRYATTKRTESVRAAHISEGAPMAEIAQVLGISRQAIHKAVTR